MAYAWRVDQWPDVEDIGPIEPPGTVIEGPEAAPNDLLNRLSKGEGTRFRMLDDDGLIYCGGRILFTTEDEKESELVFAPLNDYGMGGLGCTDIQYREKTTRGGTAWVSI